MRSRVLRSFVIQQFSRFDERFMFNELPEYFAIERIEESLIESVIVGFGADSLVDKILGKPSGERVF